MANCDRLRIFKHWSFDSLKHAKSFQLNLAATGDVISGAIERYYSYNGISQGH